MCLQGGERVATLLAVILKTECIILAFLNHNSKKYVDKTSILRNIKITLNSKQHSHQLVSSFLNFLDHDSKKMAAELVFLET